VTGLTMCCPLSFIRSLCSPCCTHTPLSFALYESLLPFSYENFLCFPLFAPPSFSAFCAALYSLQCAPLFVLPSDHLCAPLFRGPPALHHPQCSPVFTFCGPVSLLPTLLYPLH
jgi:hypothetical protein